MARQKLMGARKTKAFALSVAAGHIIRGMQALPEGHMMVSVVPFSDSVKAADTCHGTPEGSACNKARSPGKETYVRLLSGIDGTIDDALARGRDDRTRGRGGHWVDSYHQYGVGADMGPLGHQYLPEDLLDDVDWDLRRIGVDIDVAAQIPLMGTWTVNDEDFWNGCVMARWGAYWRDDARPPGWAATNARNWPVKRTVPAWGQGVPALSADTPLHFVGRSARPRRPEHAVHSLVVPRRAHRRGCRSPSRTNHALPVPRRLLQHAAQRAHPDVRQRLVSAGRPRLSGLPHASDIGAYHEPGRGASHSRPTGRPK